MGEKTRFFKLFNRDNAKEIITHPLDQSTLTGTVISFPVLRFQNIDLRMEVWSRKNVAKKHNLYMEEWLTGKI